MPFPYYRRLNRRQKAIYRASDRIGEVGLPDAAAAKPRVAALRRALAADDRAATERAAQALVGELVRQLGTEPLAVRVLSVRPSDAEAELHGLYVREVGERAIVQVWMRTAARQRVVAFRTFLRTLLHEVCHHLDYAFFSLGDSFHTEGFFRRESSLVRQLAPPKKPRPRPDAALDGPAVKGSARRRSDERRQPAPQKQLDLPI